MKRNSAVRVGAIPASGAAIPEEVSNADQGPGGFSMLGISVPDLGLQRQQWQNFLIQGDPGLVWGVREEEWCWGSVLHSRAKCGGGGPGLSLRKDIET